MFAANFLGMTAQVLIISFLRTQGDSFFEVLTTLVFGLDAP
jgi:hypothetical protein